MIIVEVGKIPADKLEESVLKKIGYKHRDVLVHAGIGEDCAVIDFGEDVLVISSDPITGASENAGYLAVHVACNDLAATGARPVGVQVVLLLPPAITDKELADLMEEIARTAQSIDVEIIGGHTEIVSCVSKPIITITAVGKADRNSYVSSSGAKPDDDLIITKGSGIEGTYILAHDYEDLLKEKGVSKGIITGAKKYGKDLSVLTEGLIAAEMGANAMHDVTEGGLYGALEEMARASGLGFDLYPARVLVRKETEIITGALELDPLGLISSGTMLIAAEDGDRIINKLESQGIRAVKIGKIREKGRYIRGDDGHKVDFCWSNRDELWSFMEKNPSFS